MNPNPMPKQLFQASKQMMKEHSALLDRAEFQRAIEVAMAQYTRTMCQLAPTSLDTPNQLQASAMCFQRIQGANDFVHCLLTLSTIQKIEVKPDTGNLKHDA